MAQHSIPVSMKESPFWKKFPLIWLFSISPKKWNHLNFYKRNPYKNESDQKKRFHKKLKSPSILKEKSLLKKMYLHFYMRNPLKKLKTEIAFNFTKEILLKFFAFNFIWKIPLKFIQLAFNFTQEIPLKFLGKKINPKT